MYILHELCSTTSELCGSEKIVLRLTVTDKNVIDTPSVYIHCNVITVAVVLLDMPT